MDKKKIRPILQEREFPATPLLPFYQQAHQHYQFAKLLGPRGRGNEALVRYYYGRCTTGLIQGVVDRDSGQLISHFITHAVIRNFYSLPFHQTCEFENAKSHFTPTLMKDIAKTLVLKGERGWFRRTGKQQYLSQQALCPNAKAWLHFISYNLIPCDHRSDVTKELALLAFCFIKGMQVKAENIIYNSITHSAKTRREGAVLAFPHLISDLFMANNVDDPDTDPHFYPKSPFDYGQIKGLEVPPVPAPVHNEPMQEEDSDEAPATRGEMRRLMDQWGSQMMTEWKHQRSENRLLRKMVKKISLKLEIEPSEDEQLENRWKGSEEVKERNERGKAPVVADTVEEEENGSEDDSEEGSDRDEYGSENGSGEGSEETLQEGDSWDEDDD